MLIDVARHTFFTVDQNPADGLIVEAPPGEIDKELRRHHHFESAEWFSYEYPDEIHNLRRPGGVATIENKQVEMELHARIFEHPEGSFVQVHYEPDRFDKTKKHLSEDYIGWEEGRNRLMKVLRESSLDSDFREAEAPWVDK